MFFFIFLGQWLINFICNQFEKEAKEGQFQLIRNHSKFSWAEDWINKTMPELKTKIEVAAIPFICCIAESTWDIEEIFKILLKPSLKSCRGYTLSEMMYCICLAFLVFQREFKLPIKYHFQIFHAISFFENEFRFTGKEAPIKKRPTGQSSLMSFGITRKKSSVNLTAEQARIASHKLTKVR